MVTAPNIGIGCIAWGGYIPSTEPSRTARTVRNHSKSNLPELSIAQTVVSIGEAWDTIANVEKHVLVGSSTVKYVVSPLFARVGHKRSVRLVVRGRK